MALTENDITAIGTLLDLKLDEKLEPFRDEVNQRFDVVQQQLDGLYQRDETREQEYLFIREQLTRLENNLVPRVAALEEKCA